MEIKKVAVLGAGLMGHGIAQVSAQVAKYEVNLRDIKQVFIDNGMKMINNSLQRFLKKGVITEAEVKEVLARIHPMLDMKEAVADADLIIEAVPEKVEIKKSVFAEVDRFAKPEVIIASNTSSISITEIASATNRPEKVCGMHFFNPPQLMKLIEIIRGARTSDETVNIIVEASKKMGKETVIVKKDSPGFIVNRILIPALNEAIFLVHEGIADPEDIDKAITLGLNWPMGPLKLLDYLGLDT
ncbi:MAG: 3-hydroxyacyl-CoA dehydrogenase family protein, partial [Candidatus Bathyarchaeia archaeon]